MKHMADGAFQIHDSLCKAGEHICKEEISPRHLHEAKQQAEQLYPAVHADIKGCAVCNCSSICDRHPYDEEALRSDE